MKQRGMKHTHAEIIHAWADGADIEYKTSDGKWVNIINPSWDPNTEYRIKPEEKKPVVRYLWAYKTDNDWQIGSYFLTEEEAKHEFRSGYQRLDWSRTEFPE